MPRQGGVAPDGFGGALPMMTVRVKQRKGKGVLVVPGGKVGAVCDKADGEGLGNTRHNASIGIYITAIIGGIAFYSVVSPDAGRGVSFFLTVLTARYLLIARQTGCILQKPTVKMVRALASLTVPALR